MASSMNTNFSQQWLESVCTQLPGVESAVFMMPERKSKQLQPLAKWPSNLSWYSDFSPVVKYVLKKRKRVYFPQIMQAEQQSYDLFALPLLVQSTVVGILVVKIRNQPEAQHNAIFSALQQSIDWLKLINPSWWQGNEFYTLVVGLLAACFEQSSYQQGLVAMVTELTHTFECERVAFSEYRGHFNHVAVISNSASFDDRSNLVQKIADAMDEAVEQDNAIIYPDCKNRLIQRAHQELARKFGCGSICTVPLIYEGERFGAITLLRSEENPFDQQTLQLCQQTFALLTPYLALKREQEKGLLHKIFSATGKGIQSLFRAKHLKAKLATISIAALLVMGSFIQGDFRVSSDAVLEGKIQRVVAAPFNGYLLSSTVRAGDTVKEGQVMASLNDVDIQLQLAKFNGGLQKARSEYREAQSSRDLVKVRVVSEQIKQISAEIKQAKQQLDRVHLYAPFDGIVIEGDLGQSLGAPVERGEPLFKIAPLEGYRIILKVDESEITHIMQGQAGILILPSLSEHQFPLTVEKITVAAKAEDGANIFRVEASLSEATELLRPGMQGVAKIYVSKERLIWILTRKITDWLRLWFWSWLP
ncbi:MAG: HlyD family efflux transporter periplasmic adaptor subunit [Gammaproteobacteria bacterium]|nr:HlyD family efflux transporter periplasmic adaptor subunit [Gammaproteobacteria bacterium]